MTIYFPSYYKEFRCIADKCKHSCCIGWEIGVDKSTLDKYSSMSGELGERVRSCVSFDSALINMCEDGRCPFLSESGLCRIISAVGEDYVSEICREHPRFYHNANGRAEGGIGAVCEEACRIILSSDGFCDTVRIEGDDIPVDTDFDSLKHRDELYSILCDGRFTYFEKLDKIREKYDLPDIYSDVDSANSLFSELEYLDEDNASRLSVGGRVKSESVQKVLIRYLAYLIYRHVSLSVGYVNMRARICFCLLLLAVVENGAAHGASFEEICEFVRAVSEEIEYSEDNTDSLIFEFESSLI